MRSIVQRFTVSFEYPVVFTRDLFAPGNRDLAGALSLAGEGRHRVVFVVDAGVARADEGVLHRIETQAKAQEERLELLAPPWVVGGGESAKNDRPALEALLQRFSALGLDRHTFVVAVGGGALLDMVGYAAATCHRGLRTVRVPTTVLAQGDSGVGVKNGVNAFGKKNFLGTFLPPSAVLIDSTFLRTLDRRDRIAGTSEALKVALLRDARFVDWIDEHAEGIAAGNEELLGRLVERSAELHLAHIATSGDPFELGSARPLDFGHWAAHKLESLSGHRVRHGEAVAIGIALDAIYAARVGVCEERLATRVLDILERLGFRLWDDALATCKADGRPVLLDGLGEFREHLGGELTITLVASPGMGVEVHAMDGELLLQSLAELQLRDARRSEAA